MEPFRSAVEPEDPRARPVQVGHGKHLATDFPITRPVNEMMAPVHGFHHVR